MKPLNTIEVTPTGWVGRGEAVIVERGKPLVVWGGIPGETAQVHVHHRGQNRSRARWISSTDPSPNRVEPVCDKYNRCGGCPLMHLDESGQRDARLEMVAELLQAQGLEAHAPTELIASPDGGTGYRYVTKLVVGRSDHGRTRLGAYARDSHQLIAIPDCHVITDKVREAAKLISHHVIDLDVFPYDERTQKGVLRHVVVRQSRADDTLLITLVAARKTPMVTELAERLADAIADVVGVHLHINDAPGNAIFQADDLGIPTLRLEGNRTITDEIAGLRLEMGPGDFFQANPATADQLVRDVVADLKAFRDRPVVDLYCGVGSFTLPLAKVHGWGLGIEVIGGAINRAKVSARRLRIDAEFIAGPVAEILPEISERLKGAAPVVVLDPSRKGLEPDVYDPLFDLEPARMVYVSCNAASLARDLSVFSARGWVVEQIRAYDMFPQTAHLELVAVLAPSDSPKATRRPPQRRRVR